MPRDLLEGYDLEPRDKLSQSFQNTNIGRQPRDLLEGFEGYSAPQQNVNPLGMALAQFINSKPGLQNFVQKGGEYGQDISDIVNALGIPGAIGGFAQGAINTPISVANLAAAPLGHRIPHFNINDVADIEPTLGNIGGQFAGELASPGGAYLKGAKYLDKFRPSGAKGILADALKGIGLGAALGEDFEGDRSLSAALGGIGGAARGITKPAVLDRILADQKAARKLSTKEYGEVFKGAEKRGIDKVKIPKLDMKNALENFNKKQKKSLDIFMKDPTIKNAHEAQSALGHIQRALERKKNGPSGLLPNEIKALDETIEAKKKLRGSIYTALPKELSSKYQKATNDYAKKVIPYEAEGITGYHGKEFGKKTAFKKLSKDEQFRIALEQYNPDFMANKLLERGITAAKYGTGAYYGGSPLLKALGIGIHHEKR